MPAGGHFFRFPAAHKAVGLILIHQQNERRKRLVEQFSDLFRQRMRAELEAGA